MKITYCAVNNSAYETFSDIQSRSVEGFLSAKDKFSTS